MVILRKCFYRQVEAFERALRDFENACGGRESTYRDRESTTGVEVLRLFYCRVRKSAAEYSRGRESVNRSLESAKRGRVSSYRG